MVKVYYLLAASANEEWSPYGKNVSYEFPENVTLSDEAYDDFVQDFSKPTSEQIGFFLRAADTKNPNRHKTARKGASCQFCGVLADKALEGGARECPSAPFGKKHSWKVS